MEEVSIIIRALLKNWLKLVILPVLSMGIVYYLLKDQPKKYKTEAKLFMNLQENKAISLGESEMKQYQILTYFQNLTQLIVAKKTVNRVCLMVIQHVLEGDSSSLSIGAENLIENKDEIQKRIKELEKRDFSLNRDHPIDTIMINFLQAKKITYPKIADQIEASRIMDSNFLKFSFSEDNPDKTYYLSEFIIAALIEENKILAKSQINGHKALIEKLVNQAKKDLDSKIKKLETFKVNNNIINLGEHTKAIVTYLVNLEIEKGNQLSKIAANEMGKKEVIKTTKEGNELSVDLSTNIEILALKEKARELVREKMLEAFSKNNFDSLETIENKIEVLKDSINDKLLELSKNIPYDPTRIRMELANRYLAYDVDIEMSKAVVDALDLELERASTYSSRFAPFESIIGTMEQEISTSQNVYLQLLNKLNITQSLEYGSGENVIEIVDPPQYPRDPEASKTMIVVIAAGVAIFVLFAGGIVILHLLDASVSSVKKFEKDSSLKVVAAIPKIKSFKKETLYSKSVNLIHTQQVIHLAKAIENNISVSSNVILFLSSQKDVDSHTLAKNVKEVMHSDSMKISLVDADWTTEKQGEEFDDITELLSDGKTLVNEKKINEKVNSLMKKNDLVIIVVAPTNLIADYQFWTKYYPKVSYIFKANAVWNKVDARLERYITNNSLDFVGTVLNNVEVDRMEDIIGDIPRPRNKIRVFVKKVLKRDF